MSWIDNVWQRKSIEKEEYRNEEMQKREEISIEENRVYQVPMISEKRHEELLELATKEMQHWLGQKETKEIEEFIQRKNQMEEDNKQDNKEAIKNTKDQDFSQDIVDFLIELSERTAAKASLPVTVLSMEKKKEIYPKSMEEEKKYQVFMKMLGDVQNATLITQLQNYVVQFSCWNQEENIGLSFSYWHEKEDVVGNSLNEKKKSALVIREFIKMMIERLQHTRNPLIYPDLFIDKNILEDYLEHFLMHRLWDKTFYFNLSYDKLLYKKIRTLQFIRFEHLDISSPKNGIEIRWDETIQILKAINDYKSPLEKLNCLLLVCERITKILCIKNNENKTIENENENNNRQRTISSADEFLPALIYVIIHSNPRHLYANLEYIYMYRARAALQSSTGYFLTHYVSSLAFIEAIDETKLSITKDEYQTSLKKSEEEEVLCEDLKEERLGKNDENRCDSREKTCNIERTNIVDFYKTSGRSYYMSSNSIPRNQERTFYDFKSSKSNHLPFKKFHFVDVKAEELSMKDIPQLLYEYQYLYHQYEIHNNRIDTSSRN